MKTVSLPTILFFATCLYVGWNLDVIVRSFAVQHYGCTCP